MTSSLFALLFLAACSTDPSSSTIAVPARVSVVTGDAQLADVGDSLPHPIRFQVTDAHDRPVGGVTVTLAVTVGDGTVPESRKTTDADGMVETVWVMGRMGGVQLLEASVNAGIIAIASAATCLPGDCFPESRLEGPLSDATLLTLATYDSSGQAMHPDVVHGHGAAGGFWLAATPYPGGDLTRENPSIFRSAAAGEWHVPDGVTNPLALPSGANGYNSDPDIIFNPTDQRLWLYYRSYSAQQNMISLLRSADGSHWDRSTTVITVPSHQLVSPSIVRGAPHAPWLMWGVNAGPQGCSATRTTVERRTSTDGLSWSTATMTDLAQPGQVIWHIDVEWVAARAEYWALYNTFPAGSSCATHELYLARSTDGVHWTVSPSPIARSGLIEQFSDIIYRSTFITDSKANRVMLWMSGAAYIAGNYVWRTATVATSSAELFAI
ncbi:MAG: hypothetical protein ABUL71_01810, partial [Gemmatimonadota bacterium]